MTKRHDAGVLSKSSQIVPQTFSNTSQFSVTLLRQKPLILLHVGVFSTSKTNRGEKTGLCRSHPDGCLRHAQRKGGKLRGYFGDDPAEALAK